ncbi:MAG: hypothetical protein A2469_04820 [Candidatus Magasanikbacteria bacterium RIFOXYC2_FULL_40_16]|uniref:Uncharacterized protein n=3 Tax=Candidatus Magasanikiibacteriota TaxID=1752731 RepID=A0A1F6ND99_9BACT|nr:MAG: hypothetical protein A2224_00570 [Candidatus Magasanikbacteria bacterium RIFOXYA2_FULL_40_20]OGH81917.1 MAG: hypothetical protein A2373_04370 [Candidatus Magasanikbacteria bacterium RIFOXYB1_FULL_40_15]OGH86607.1 MAG: hypothetical protein A2301_02295 [Candidatus Magasanikbacteria bacterium RIFOXYB2_FULL_40_13]OGH87341.1 MAG: hypothetical protein A2206_02115 [Candidatus Magasanikbacteria bacterium RIFOXYA1_FULL_40_8]OGH89353.1 MAG: hypothetical protein A2469_04820 [Candidatus Magasanikba
MKVEKINAIKLRKLGKSYNEISKSLKIPKSTLSYWLRDIVLSKKAKTRIENRVYEKSVKALIRRNKEQTVFAKERAKEIREKAAKEVKKIRENDLFLVGISLYWGEGYKKGAEGSIWKCVDFTNSDSTMVMMMMRFFREICKVEEDKMRVQVILHRNLSGNKAVEYWSRVTGIKKDQFMKVSRSLSSASKGKSKNILKYGTIHLRVYNTKLFYKLIGWIDGLKKQI